MEAERQITDLGLPPKSFFHSSFSNKVYTVSKTSTQNYQREVVVSTPTRTNIENVQPTASIDLIHPLPPAIKQWIEDKAKSLAFTTCKRDNIIPKLQKLLNHSNNSTFPSDYHVSIKMSNKSRIEEFVIMIKTKLLEADLERLREDYIAYNTEIAEAKVEALMFVYSHLKEDNRFLNSNQLYWSDVRENPVVTQFNNALANHLTRFALQRAENDRKKLLEKEAKALKRETEKAAKEKESKEIAEKIPLDDPTHFLLLEMRKLKNEFNSFKSRSGKELGALKTLDAPAKSEGNPHKHVNQGRNKKTDNQPEKSKKSNKDHHNHKKNHQK
jgi:hypothetical protein